MRKTLAIRIVAAMVAAAALLHAPPVRAQPAGNAGLEGRILDDSGDGMPGVRVRLTNPKTSVGERVVMTDVEGYYRFNLLPPGNDYMLEASIPSYATVVAGPLDLQPSRVTRLNLTLRTSADLEETIRVEAKGEIVDTSSTATRTLVTSELIEGLPLVGRSFSDVLTLAPGVTDPDGDGNLNVRGARDTGLQLRIDGTNATNPLTGHFGQDVNLETIEDVEIITAGAAAEFGRSDGGFANVITKSGGNDTEGSFKLFYRSDFFDGDGAGPDGSGPAFNDTNLILTGGGAIVRDHVWYFGSLDRIDEEIPVRFTGNQFGLRTKAGTRAFAKFTWQANSENKLAIQVNYDPAEFEGNNIGPVIAPESDYRLKVGGPLPQFTWTATLSPALLLQVVASHLNGNLEIEPLSPHYRELDVEIRKLINENLAVPLPCTTRNCQDDSSTRRFFHPGGDFDSPLLEAGPYSFQTDQALERTTVRSDLAYSIEGGIGQHAVKGGFEFNVERYEERSVSNPVLTDLTCALTDPTCVIPGGVHPPTTRFGTLLMEVFDPLASTRQAEAFAVGAYVQDSWKPVPNFTVNLGVRFDREEIDSLDVTPFDPRPEAAEALRRFDLWCDAAGGTCTNSRQPGRMIGSIPQTFAPPPGHPALQFDLNGDGLLETQGPEGKQILEPFTLPSDRASEAFNISNNNPAPRVSISWDPWADGKTKVFGSWGVFYDRLFLGTVTTAQQPGSFIAQWKVGNNIDPQTLSTLRQAEPGALSEPLNGIFSVNQVDRSLETPRTIETTIGIERELAPEWAVSLTYVKRRGRDLLQDEDINHITCKGFDGIFHVEPMAVCGDGGELELDRFGNLAFIRDSNGRIVGAAFLPNGAPDLYNLNPNFNQVLRVGNFNSSEFASWDLSLRRRLHRSWQMLFSYTYSKAFGDAESFVNLEGNDPAVSDKVSGFLDFDQRHVAKMQVVTRLPSEILIGGTFEWASGLPYSLIANVVDVDDRGNVTPQRVFPLTGRKNDQRNESQFTLNARVEKRLPVGRTHMSAFVEAENLLNSGDLVLRRVDRDQRGLVDGTRRFGRRWELGAAFFF